MVVILERHIFCDDTRFIHFSVRQQEENMLCGEYADSVR